MAYLIDTTILGRLANLRDMQHAVAVRAVLELHRRGEVLHVTPQVMVEFRNVATRRGASETLIRHGPLLGAHQRHAKVIGNTEPRSFSIPISKSCGHASWLPPLQSLEGTGAFVDRSGPIELDTETGDE